jgi:guanine deaminase
MCLGALYWARPARVYFAATQADAAAAGFDDAFIYKQIGMAPSERDIPMIRVGDAAATRPFEEWIGRTEKTEY